MICFYHSADLDGHCSGGIVKHRYPECELYGINYGDDFPWAKIGQDVWMVDFHLQPFDDMLKLSELVEPHNLIWVDHHKSALEDADKYGFKPFGIRRNGIGACQLTYEYIWTEKQDLIGIPQGIQLLAQYDVWNHSNPETLPYQYGMRLENTDPENQKLWKEIIEDDEIGYWVEKGNTVLEYVRQDNQKYIKAAGFETSLDGLRCIAVNKMLTNSQLFDSVWDNSKYDAMLTFGYRKGKWTVSLYSDRGDVDVSIIAKARGGGGHKGAAGFQCDILPFEI